MCKNSLYVKARRTRESGAREFSPWYKVREINSRGTNDEERIQRTEHAIYKTMKEFFANMAYLL